MNTDQSMVQPLPSFPDRGPSPSVPGAQPLGALAKGPPPLEAGAKMKTLAVAAAPLFREISGAETGKIIGLVFGPNGSGKTTVLRDCHSPGGKSLIIAADANYRSLPGRKFVADVENWEQFALAVERIPYDQFDMIGVDTITQVLELVQSHECRKLGVEHPGDDDTGKVWNAMKVEVGRVLTKLEMRAKNVLYLAQEGQLEVSSVPGRRIVKAVSQLSGGGSARRVRAAVNLIGRIEVDGQGKRSLNFRLRDESEGKDTFGYTSQRQFVIEATGTALWESVHGAGVPSAQGEQK